MGKTHFFLVNSEHFEVTYSEDHKSLKIVSKEDIRIENRIKTGIISLSPKNYAFIQPDTSLPFICAPIDKGYTGDLTLITSRPITIPKGYTFHLLEIVKSDEELKGLPMGMSVRKPAYKGDIGRDCYLTTGANNPTDVQFVVQNHPGQLYFPRSSAAKKGYEVQVSSNVTVIRKSDLSLLTLEEAFSVIQLVKGNISLINGDVKFVDGDLAHKLSEELNKKYDRGSKGEGSSDKRRK